MDLYFFHGDRKERKREMEKGREREKEKGEKDKGKALRKEAKKKGRVQAAEVASIYTILHNERKETSIFHSFFNCFL